VIVHILSTIVPIVLIEAHYITTGVPIKTVARKLIEAIGVVLKIFNVLLVVTDLPLLSVTRSCIV